MTLKKTLVTLAILGTLALAGCSATAPVSTTKTTPASTKADNKPCPEATAASYGDVIPKEAVTDKYGKYCHTTINPKAAALQWDASKIDTASLTSRGFTDEDAKKVQKLVLTYVAEQTLDSTRLDNYSQTSEQWVEANSKWFTPSATQAYLTALQAGKTLSTAGLLVTNRLPEPVLRNGTPRATKTTIDLFSIFGMTQTNGLNTISVSTTATAEYLLTNKDIIQMYLTDNPESTKEQLFAADPSLKDEKAKSLLFMKGKFTYGFKPDSLDKISGSRTDWTMVTVNNTLIVK